LKLFLVRHGETHFNNAGRIQGWMDSGLNEHGREQVRSVVDHLPDDTEFTIATSPLRRARQSARILRKALSLPEPVVVEEFRELNQGYWNGLREETVERVDTERYRHWKQNPLEQSPPEGESLETVKKRVRNGLRSILEFDSPVLVVAHKVVNSMIYHISGKCTFDSVMDSLPENAAVFEIVLDEGKLEPAPNS